VGGGLWKSSALSVSFFALVLSLGGLFLEVGSLSSSSVIVLSTLVVARSERYARVDRNVWMLFFSGMTCSSGLVA
jgi:hypothetical protein